MSVGFESSLTSEGVIRRRVISERRKGERIRVSSKSNSLLFERSDIGLVEASEESWDNDGDLFLVLS